MNRAGTIALAPLGTLYGAVMKARRALYQRGLLKVHQPGVPVISVGNITTGGTGKTPLVEWIANEAASRKRRVCILTRGYGRPGPGDRVIVSDATEVLSDAERAGDEALLLAEHLRGRAAVISDADRVSAARWAIAGLQSDLLVLDDGFQHLRVARNLDIVTIDAMNPAGNGRLLPAGILREPFSQIARADCVVITRADFTDNIENLEKEIESVAAGLPIFRSRMKPLRLRSINPGGEAAADIDEVIKTRPAAAICAIGNPQSFFAQLRRDGYRLCHARSFRDHHNFTQNDIDQFIREARLHGAEAILTTAKDEVKLRAIEFDLPCYVNDITIEIDDPAKLRDMLKQAIGIASSASV